MGYDTIIGASEHRLIKDNLIVHSVGLEKDKHTVFVND